MVSIERAQIESAWRDVLLSPPSPEQADAIERRLSGAIGTLTDRLRLYYHLATSVKLEISRLIPHLVVIVEAAPFLDASNSLGLVTPGTPEHRLVAEAWRKALSEWPEDPSALVNASDFFLDNDFEQASRLVQGAVRYAPSDPTVLLRAAALELYGLDLGRPECAARAALKFAERALENPAAPRYGYALAATAAYESSQDAQAQIHALEASRTDCFNPFDNIHRGMTVLGGLALSSGNVARATELLDRSARGRLGYRGPSLRLARQLVVAGAERPVLAYLGAVKDQWDGPREKCDEWMDAVRTHDLGRLRNPGQ